MEDSLTSMTVDESRGGGPEMRGIDLSPADGSSVRVGLGTLGYNEQIVISWEVTFGGCEATVQASIECSPLGAIDSNTVLNEGAFSLMVDKTDGLTEATPGTAHQYTVTIGGDSCPVPSATVTDMMPPELVSPTWTCSASAGSSCGAGGSGDINDSVTIAADGTLTYTIDSTINPSATGVMENTLVIEAVDDGRGVNIAEGTDETTLVPAGDLDIFKTDNQDVANPGDPVTYSVLVTNNGPSDAVGAAVSDIFPPEFENAEWTCIASAGSSCTAMGTGDINEVVDIAAGGDVEFVIDGNFAADASGEVLNVAIVDPPDGFGPPQTTEEASDITSVGSGADILEIPTLGQWGMGLMVLLLTGCGVLVIGRRGSLL